METLCMLACDLMQKYFRDLWTCWAAEDKNFGWMRTHVCRNPCADPFYFPSLNKSFMIHVSVLVLWIIRSSKIKFLFPWPLPGHVTVWWHCRSVNWPIYQVFILNPPLEDGVLYSCRHPGGAGGLGETVPLVPAKEGTLYLKSLYYVLQKWLDVRNPS